MVDSGTREMDVVGFEPHSGWDDADWDRYYQHKYNSEFVKVRKSRIDAAAKKDAVEDASVDGLMRVVKRFLRRIGL